MHQIKLLTLLAILCNLPYATAHFLIFTFVHYQQVAQLSHTFHISIKQWLQITALFQLSYISSALCIFIFFTINPEKQNFSLLLFLCYKFFHTIFQFTWNIVGVIMHWKQELGVQSSQLNLYLHLVLIQILLLGLQWGFWFYHYRNNENGVIKLLSRKSLGRSKKSKGTLSARSEGRMEV